MLEFNFAVTNLTKKALIQQLKNIKICHHPPFVPMF